MRKTNSWTVESTFALGLGWLMAGFLATACFSVRGSEVGSALVPAAVLQKLVDQGRSCQTLTDEEVFTRAPRRGC